MKGENFVPEDTSFDALVGGLGLEVLRPSSRPVLYLLPAPRPLLSPEGALLLFRPQEASWVLPSAHAVVALYLLATLGYQLLLAPNPLGLSPAAF